MKDVLSINIGQCGIQVASCFWGMFFKNLKLDCGNLPPDWNDVRSFVLNTNVNVPSLDASPDAYNDFINNLKARCILIDTDLSTITEVLQKQHHCHIDNENIVCGTEAAGNNWSVAYFHHGPQYHQTVEDLIDHNLEKCDKTFQYFNITFGLSGGTGGGLGNYILDILRDNYSKIHRVCNVVTQDSMAAISPYNTLFCLNHLNEVASVTNLFSNEALSYHAMQKTAHIIRESSRNEAKKEHGFSGENEIISKHIKDISMASVSEKYPSFSMSSVLNTLIPFPELNLVCPQMVPEHVYRDGMSTEGLINELLKSQHRISPIDQKIKNAPIAMAIYGDFDYTSLKYIKRLKLKHNMIGWMRDGIHVSLSGVSSRNTKEDKPDGMCGMSNDCAISSFLGKSISNFERLYSKKAFLHHFSDTLEDGDFSSVKHNMESLQDVYTTIQKYMVPSHNLLDEKNLKSLGVEMKVVSDAPCRDPWNNVPGNLVTNKRHWWELKGRPLV
ncbi:Tubulin GTPase domain containing protein [Babesia bovis T2Bo]|uniref:Tubulin, putative n=1 Tax=Babesia bovis TaxID=5865 RepID=A7ARU2_BABBO|nr:Tubulin GTPase domain containing protein [Babesia bovis T2Bo]EDO07261.1 Tubulin GTPase domain containing protein [Babesia bovis T2Bo]|eukprot:XP_001610829.1 tubulin [Babesia bovis T2Bo]